MSSTTDNVLALNNTSIPNLSIDEMTGDCHTVFTARTLRHSYSDPFMNQIHYVNDTDDIAHNEKRSAHNALERQRREGLNTKFQELAHALPSLKLVKRPSKSMIVSKSLEFVTTAEERANEYHSQIQALKDQHKLLMRQAEIASKKKLKRKRKEKLATKPSSTRASPEAGEVTQQVSQPSQHDVFETQPVPQAVQSDIILTPTPPAVIRKSPSIDLKRRMSDQSDMSDQYTKKVKPNTSVASTPYMPQKNYVLPMPAYTSPCDSSFYSTTPEYELYAPFPDYPIQINSIPATSTPIKHNHRSSSQTSKYSLYDSIVEQYSMIPSTTFYRPVMSATDFTSTYIPSFF